MDRNVEPGTTVDSDPELRVIGTDVAPMGTADVAVPTAVTLYGGPYNAFITGCTPYVLLLARPAEQKLGNAYPPEVFAGIF
jgi:hypothetical protein